MSYETNRCDRIVCDYPDCHATTRLWREDEDSAFSDADDLNWLTVEVGLDGDDYVERHFCPRHRFVVRVRRPLGRWGITMAYSGFLYTVSTCPMVLRLMFRRSSWETRVFALSNNVGRVPDSRGACNGLTLL